VVAATFAAAGLISGGTVLVRNWPHGQAGSDAAADIFADMDGYVVSSAAGLTVTSRSTSGTLQPVARSLRDHAELVPLVAVLAACATGTSTLTGLPVGSGREVADNLQRLGGAVTLSGGELVIEPRSLTGGLWEPAGSAELAMAGAVLGLMTPDLEIAGWGALDTIPRGFTAEWLRMISADEYLVPGSAQLPHEYL
jgi:3-phosphoshikimate 1-carboxyvinyltransferase